MQKFTLKVDWSCEKTKKKAIKIVSENKDVQGFAVDDEKKQLTVDGGVDPISLVKKMRKKFPTEIVFMETEASRALEASRAPSGPQAPSAPPEPNPGFVGHTAYGHSYPPGPYDWAQWPYWDGYGPR
ncbi:HMA domain-containing protein [Psidium guajava]|nr:HMA domain-containing protein [Psidium guajava]